MELVVITRVAQQWLDQAPARASESALSRVLSVLPAEQALGRFSLKACDAQNLGPNLAYMVGFPIRVTPTPGS